MKVQVCWDVTPSYGVQFLMSRKMVLHLGLFQIRSTTAGKFYSRADETAVTSLDCWSEKSGGRDHFRLARRVEKCRLVSVAVYTSLDRSVEHTIPRNRSAHCNKEIAKTLTCVSHDWQGERRGDYKGETAKALT